MNTPKTTITIIVFCLLLGRLYGQESDPMSFTLVEAQTYALENSNLIKNAKADVEENKWFTREIITEGLPQITSEASYKNQFNLLESVIPASSFTSGLPPALLPPNFDPNADMEVTFGVQHNASYEIMLNQLIVDGRYFIGLKANRALIDVTKGKLELTQIEIKNIIASTYYACLAAQLNKQLVDSNMTNINKVLFETTELYKAGFAEELDVDRLKLNQLNLQSAKRKADLQYQLSLNVLKYQMGLNMDVKLNLTENLEGLLAFGEDIGNKEFNHQNRVEYKMLTAQLKLKGFDVQRFRAGYFPSLYFFTGYGFANQRNDFNDIVNEKWFTQGYFGLKLNVPIFDSYRKGSQLQQAKWRQAKAQNDLQNFEQQAALEVNQAKTNYTSAFDEYNSQQANLALAKKIHSKVLTMYSEGIGSSIELAEAESDLTQAQASFVNAVYNLLVKKVELEKALGQL